MFDSQGTPIPKGYRSDGAKRKFTLFAGLLGVAFFVLQAVIPLFLLLALARTFRGFEQGRDDWPHVWNAVFWNGALWYVQESIPRRMAPKEEATLQRLDPDGTGRPETVTSVFMEDPRLLAGSDRLWIISPEDVRYFKDGRRTSVNVGWRLGDISDPFLLNGDPAVLEERPEGVALTVFHDGKWTRGPLFKLGSGEDKSPIASRIRVIACEGQIHLFMSFGRTVHHRVGLPQEARGDSETWDPVASSGQAWSAVCLDGGPTVFVVVQDAFTDTLVAHRKGDRGWAPCGEYPLRARGGAVGVAPEGPDSRFLILTSWYPRGLTLSEVRNGVLTPKAVRFPSEGEIKFGRVVRVFMAAGACYLAAPIIFAMVLSGLMSQCRTSEYESDPLRAQLAPLWRRALAEIVDCLILGGPVLAGYLEMLWPVLHPFRNTNASAPSTGLLLILGGLGWSFGGLFLFSWLEGKWGVTPGKWAAGIQVLGTDLQPCGFLRGLVRNLLKAVDGFFNFMVGMLVTALSENWQRVGDMAARTIVVRAGSEKLTPGGAESGPPVPRPDIGAQSGGAFSGPAS